MGWALGPSSRAWAEDGRAPDSVADAASDSDDYQFSWLDPDKKIYVLQNRKYTKSRRLLLSAMFGLGFSNPYRSIADIEPRAAFYISEDWGVELFFNYTSNSVNGTFNALAAAVGSTTLPTIREFRTGYGAQLHWSPWYAKINVFNQILFFDWYFGAGVGRFNTILFYPGPISQDITPFMLSTGHQFHFNRMWTVRMDFTAMIYNAPLFGTTGDNTWFSDYRFRLGLGLRL